MPSRFVPLRIGPPLPVHLNARLMQIENALVKLGEPPVSDAVVQQAKALKSAGTGAVSSSVGSGGGSPDVLGGDVTGAPVNNTVSNLQANKLVLTGVGQGDLITYNGGNFTNLQALLGNYTLTGNTPTATLTVQPATNTITSPEFVCDDFSNNVIFWVHTRPDLDPGFHPATVGIAPTVGSKRALLVTGASVQTANLTEWQTNGGSLLLSVQAAGHLAFADGVNVVAGTTTGTRIGTLGGAAGQKLGFFNATPIVQPLLATGAGHTVDDVITVLQNLGLVRQV